MKEPFRSMKWVNDPIFAGLRDNQCSRCGCLYLDALSLYLEGPRVFVVPEYTSLENCRKIVSAWNDNKRKCNPEGKWAHPKLRSGPPQDEVASDLGDVDFNETHVVCAEKINGRSYIGMVYDADVKESYVCMAPMSLFKDLDDFCRKFMDGQWDADVDTLMGLEITNFWGLVGW